MHIDKEVFETWMRRIMERFDHLEKGESRSKKQYGLPKGEHLLDNQDICQLLNISKRTLQRYRTLKQLPYHTIYHKTYYRESELLAFIKNHFDDKDFMKGNKNNENNTES
ncbi:transcriptional regulator [Bacteroidia bacterium]|nr:transcriptional regulator [Bacteroidia bacterium]